MDGLPLNALSGGRLEFAGQSPQQSRLARAVDTDQAYTLTWSETPGQILDEYTAVRSLQTRVFEFDDNLAEPTLRERRKSDRVTRCRNVGDQGLCGSMRYFGLDVRAGAPRRSHASSLRARLRRRSSEASA